MNIIAAVDINGGIGKDGELLFHLPSDMAFFKKMTQGGTVIMGRKTYQSIGRPLPDRRNIVLTRNKDFKAEGVETADSVQKLLEMCVSDAFVIGGGEVYGQLIKYCDTAYITKILKNGNGNVFMPKLRHEDGWEQTEQSDIYIENGVEFQFCIYKKLSL